MTDVIQIGRVGTLKNRHEFGKLENALESLDGRLDGLAGPYQIRRPGEKFGRKRDKDETIARVRALLTDNEAGLRLVIRGSDSDEQPIAIRLTLTTEGPEVLLEAIRNLGVPYLFGAMNPAGPTGGKGGQLDCSGLVCVCYASVDVDLPHRAEGIHVSSQVDLFKDQDRIQPGDMVLYHTGSQGLPSTQADHCAILVDRDTQIAAPATGEVVQRQPVNLANLLTFAFVRSVTGAH